MISRKCPQCGTAWHSSDEESTWVCEKCGCAIPPKENIVVINGKPMRFPLEGKTVAITGSPPASFYLDIMSVMFGLPTIEDNIRTDKPIQRMKKQAERATKPLNYTREMERRKRQIEKGMIKVTAHAT